MINNNFKPKMKYYAFDWDDNILNMPTVIHMKHLVHNKWIDEDVSTSKFAEVRNLENWKDHEDSYLEFRDFGHRGQNAFFEDCIKAINNKNFGPSWEIFLNTLSNGSIFSIITARGHEPETLRRSVEFIIENILSKNQKNEMISNLIGFKDMFIKDFDFLEDINPELLISNYLDKCSFFGVSSPSFEKKYNQNGGATNPEKMKIIALEEFINTIKLYGEQIDGIISLGFSDDDIKNVDKVHNFFGEISSLYNIIFSVFDTSNQNIIGGIKKEI